MPVSIRALFSSSFFPTSSFLVFDVPSVYFICRYSFRLIPCTLYHALYSTPLSLPSFLFSYPLHKFTLLRQLDNFYYFFNPAVLDEKKPVEIYQKIIYYIQIFFKIIYKYLSSKKTIEIYLFIYIVINYVKYRFSK